MEKVVEALILFTGLSIVSTIGVVVLLYQHIKQNRLTKHSSGRLNRH